MASLGDGVMPLKQSMNILDPEPLRRKGRPPTKRKQSAVEKAVTKKKVAKKKILPNEKTKEVAEIAVDHVFGTQESVVNVNSYPSYMVPSMWPNMMPNMTQSGSIYPFDPSLYPIGTNFNQFAPNFPASQVWAGGQSSFTGSQGHGWGAQPSFIEMLNTKDDGEE